MAAPRDIPSPASFGCTCLRLRKAARRSVLKRHGAELVLHGHDHVQALDWLEGPHGPIPALGVPSASAALMDGHHVEPAAYNLYRIDGSAGAWRCEMVTRGFRAGADRIGELNRRELTLPS